MDGQMPWYQIMGHAAMPQNSGKQWKIWMPTIYQAHPTIINPIYWQKHTLYCKTLWSKARETGKNPHFVLMLYRNTPFGNDLKSWMEGLCTRQARSDLTMSHAARIQTGQVTSARLQTDRPQAETVRPKSKNQVQATSNPLSIGTH